MRHCWGTTTMPHTRSGHDRDRSRDMRTRNRRLGPLVQHPPPPLPGRHHTTTSRKSTHNNTKGSGLNKPPQNPGFDTPAKGHCTRYVALHPLRGAAPVTSRCTRTEGVQCLQIGCNAYRSGARPPPQAHMRTCPKGRPRTRQAWLGPAATNPRQPTGPGGNEPPTINRPGSNAPPTTNSARQRTPDSQPGPRAAGPDGPSRRRAERAARGAARHQARARRSRAAEPGRGAHIRRARTAGHTYNEAGASRAQQHDRAPAS